jgi:hypothetical protein
MFKIDADELGRQTWEQAAKALGLKGDLDILWMTMVTTFVAAWKPILGHDIVSKPGLRDFFRAMVRSIVDIEITDDTIDRLLEDGDPILGLE